MVRINPKLSALVAGVLVGAGTLSGCGGGGEDAGGSGGGGPIDMWVRASTASQSQALADAWNADHKQKVNLTVVPTDNYLQKVGVAAGSGELPCLMASDVVYMPNFVQKNLYQDITDRVKGLDYFDHLAKGHIRLASKDGAIYGVPHNVAVSALFQNDVVLEKAGIDPAQPVKSLDELGQNAKKVADLGGNYIGLYYTGNNAGSISFTHFPAIWASGGQALNKDGTESLLDSDESVAVFKAFNDMSKSGASPASVKNESGATRNDVFAKGNVGYMLASNSVLESVPESATLKIGAQGIPGVDGGVSSYVGGDSIGITSSCKDVDGAWSFLEWSLSEDAQVGVFAKMNQLSVRDDLAENKYTEKDPRLVAMNKLVGEGDTPYAMNYGQTFNDPNGPALTVFRDALFGDDPAGALKKGNDSITASLAG